VKKSVNTSTEAVAVRKYVVHRTCLSKIEPHIPACTIRHKSVQIRHIFDPETIPPVLESRVGYKDIHYRPIEADTILAIVASAILHEDIIVERSV
jgi:hypothetical protein